MLLLPGSDCKVLRSTNGVQLIVFFALIREILRRNIYGADNKDCMFDENKGVICEPAEGVAVDSKFPAFEIRMERWLI
jgi:hypothetical protein